eukprot:TRINITY_DN708_c0_g1_i1.p1 TRINITY_DN708_c0_g1~~TRINITY_DN708_c0_g1_i1.p1  ORF type:complete len:406 (-),score=92.87 TRINITY_DN708_c0_g1_i1:476-1693(-)
MQARSSRRGADLRGELAAGRFRLENQIGHGSFGEIWLCRDIKTKKVYAMKLENARASHVSSLGYEASIYTVLRDVKGVPNARLLRHQVRGHNAMLLELLGESLEQLFERMNRHFTLVTVLMMADQLIQRFQDLHSKHFIFRDTKPDNFLIGRPGYTNMVYIIDFGLSKRYRHPRTREHIRFVTGKHMVGTPRYASIAAHLGYEQGRKDDLESLGYVLVYMLKGSLPWQGLKAKTPKEKYRKILDKKTGIPLRDLCDGLPSQFYLFLKHCRELEFEDEPDYKYLRGLFTGLLSTLFDEHVFDWNKERTERSEPINPSTERVAPASHTRREEEMGRHRTGGAPVARRVVPDAPVGRRVRPNPSETRRAPTSSRITNTSRTSLHLSSRTGERNTGNTGSSRPNFAYNR